MKPIPGLGVVIAAGGSSSRYGESNKLFEKLDDLPVFLHCIRNFAPAVAAGSFVLVIPEQWRADYDALLEAYLPEIKVTLVSGGANRTESVKNGLKALPEDTRIVAIHDAARPLADIDLLCALVETVQRENCGAIAAGKMVDSVCRSGEGDFISESVPRENLWRIQTPQVFPYRELCRVYEMLGDAAYTDDSAAFRACGFAVKVCDNPKANMKLTYKEDLPLLSYLLRNK